MKRRCLQANKESTDYMLENCYGLTELTCVVRWKKPHQALDERHGHEKHQNNPATPPWKPGIITVLPTTLNLEAVKVAPEGSVLTHGDSVWAGDADRFSASGTASWAQSKPNWYPITASGKKQ